MSNARLPFAAMLAALALASAGCNRDHKVTVRETIEETPGKAGPVMLNMGDPKQEKLLVSGFYGIEAKAWRWTAQDFTVSLPPSPAAAAHSATPRAWPSLSALSGLRWMKTRSIATVSGRCSWTSALTAA